jgi:hypothetical protein
MPKSISLACCAPLLSVSSMMFSGFRSRWSTPSRCAALSAWPTSRTIAAANSRSSPVGRITDRSDTPLTNSITKKGRPSGVRSRSMTRTTPGWWIRVSASASCRNFLDSQAFCVESSSRNLMTTGISCSRRSRAR